MKVSLTATIWIDYQRAHSKKNTVRSYKPIIDQLCLKFGDFEIDQVTSDDVLRFLNRFTEGNKPYTKRIRSCHICSFLISSATISITTCAIHATLQWSANSIVKGSFKNGKSSKKKPWTKSFSELPSPGIG